MSKAELPLDIRLGVQPEELPGVIRLVEETFGVRWDEQDADFEATVVPAERMLTARFGQTLAGSGFSWSWPLVVPGGGALPCAAVSGVGVRADMRRRGVLTGLMGRLLAEARMAGEPVAALWASEASIYGRFGFGMAAGRLVPEVPRGARLVGPSFAGPLRLLEGEAAMTARRRVHEAAARPGFLLRDEAAWKILDHDAPYRRDGRTPLRTLVAGPEHEPLGYASFSLKGKFTDTGPAGTVQVGELHTTDPAAHAALWRWLTDVDLTTTVICPHGIAVDDPLVTMLAEPRRARLLWADGLWVRLIDLPAALTGRAWSAEVDVVIEVRDAACPWNAGRWHLRTGGGDGGGNTGTSCDPTTATADLSLDVATLGAVFLGGPRLTALARAGRVEEHRPGSVVALSQAAGTEQAPWTPRIF